MSNYSNNKHTHNHMEQQHFAGSPNKNEEIQEEYCEQDDFVLEQNQINNNQYDIQDYLNSTYYDDELDYCIDHNSAYVKDTNDTQQEETALSRQTILQQQEDIMFYNSRKLKQNTYSNFSSQKTILNQTESTQERNVQVLQEEAPPVSMFNEHLQSNVPVQNDTEERSNQNKNRNFIQLNFNKFPNLYYLNNLQISNQLFTKDNIKNNFFSYNFFLQPFQNQFIYNQYQIFTQTKKWIRI